MSHDYLNSNIWGWREGSEVRKWHQGQKKDAICPFSVIIVVHIQNTFRQMGTNLILYKCRT